MPRDRQISRRCDGGLQHCTSIKRNYFYTVTKEEEGRGKEALYLVTVKGLRDEGPSSGSWRAKCFRTDFLASGSLK